MSLPACRQAGEEVSPQNNRGSLNVLSVKTKKLSIEAFLNFIWHFGVIQNHRAISRVVAIKFWGSFYQNQGLFF
ncbi:MAG: hypothetical protein CO140_03710 [Candidatus Moranbacteria bacterium CG_4_9_14_3_um_filter_40_7]|nr:MAG: hypothetical protein COX31_00625 [Candidatus Moranbacteria bacterium CG23_combo_of_CG06-09_8_20_14_all_40_16]PIU80398.1 MAG: hypothetical protein COS71_03865 [Candidatus Moranbacteria bacterium CG06_land_8_20_14_3_00_40_12]PJA87550.1 MAG: hypothetical protein CO140_03710 [Candidatus Moranbacteria bacterium CG_4_9_14_3_um_filter_40_7]